MEKRKTASKKSKHDKKQPMRDISYEEYMRVMKKFDPVVRDDFGGVHMTTKPKTK